MLRKAGGESSLATRLMALPYVNVDPALVQPPTRSFQTQLQGPLPGAVGLSLRLGM